jgi:hypothetical protein
MTLISPFLHGGMQVLNFYGYLAVDIAMLLYYMMADSHRWFVFADGYQWVNACALYVFAGFFSLHGWPFKSIGTCLTFLLLSYVSFWLFSRDILAYISPNYHRYFRCFRMTIAACKAPCGFRFVVGRPVIYKSPLIYVYGTSAIYFFHHLPVPAFLSGWVIFFARSIFMVHLFAPHPCVSRNIRPWRRWNEMIRTPLLSLLNSLRMLFCQALAGISVDLLRTRLFDESERAISWSMERGSALLTRFKAEPVASSAPLESL